MTTAMHRERTGERTGRLVPLRPQDPAFLLAWRLEVELQTARNADAEDWAKAARAAIVHPRGRVSYARTDGRTDHPGGPVPVW